MIKFAGIALGIVIGGVVAPIAFNGIGLSDPAAATVGCLAGAVCGYAMVRAVLLIERWRRDRELRQAAEAVRDEHGLPPSIHVRVKNAHVLLDGVVEDYSQRYQAECVISTAPGIRGVVNKPAGRMSAGENCCSRAWLEF